MRKRYYSQLAPPQVCGVRGLVDAAALLWRWRLTTSDWDAALSRAGSDFEPAFVAETSPPPVDAVLAAVDAELLASPQTPFVALHAAVALAGAADRAALSRLADHCHRADDQTVQGIVAPVADALLAVLDDRYAAAAALLGDLVPVLARVGGSAAQREVIEETLLFCLVSAGESERARDLLDGRLDRRPSPLDARRRRSLDLVPRPATAGASAATPS